MVPPSDNSFHHCFHILLALLLFSLQILTHHIQAYGSKVEVLPGFQGPLPFELETGSTILIIPFSISLLFNRNDNFLFQFHLNYCRIWNFNLYSLIFLVYIFLSSLVIRNFTLKLNK
jgi:hypothetical protein